MNTFSLFKLPNLTAGLRACLAIISIAALNPVMSYASNTHNEHYDKLPLQFDGYQTLIQQYPKAKYIYPSSFTISKSNDLYIQYIFEPKQKTNVVVKYDKDRKFSGYALISNGGRGVGGEGLVIAKSPSGVESLVAGSNQGKIQFYDLERNFEGQQLHKNSEVNVGLFNEFAHYKDKWLVEANDGNMSIQNPRNKLVLLDEKFNVIKEIEQPLEYSGFITDFATHDAKQYNKRQGLSLGENFFISGYGAYYQLGKPQTLNTYPGYRVFDINGKLIQDNVSSPSDFFDKKPWLKPYSRIENEGVFFDPDRNLISAIYIYLDRKYPELVPKEGVLITYDTYISR
ncbi:hypothetical protein [Candidatus Pantoea multigeneris]|uniref:Uncharacterized protein n=1 Tax=Candidatus Pantoea multigeneris TaxID=2608357 RepID=A0ABX0R723_9GAMM|nr:hypothetical protein [Pantoea multigeneris]NIF21180.1 hypothetical protein [Pantoea multigeneris]